MSFMDSTQQTIQKLLSPHKGILANDASVASLTQRLNKYGIEATEENRNAFRKIFYTTPGIELYISGVILNEEAISFAPLLANRGILPGVKVDRGLVPFGMDGKEYTTDGIETLESRLSHLAGKAVRFTKWRAAFVISSTSPSDSVVDENIRLLAEYARISLAHELVPILEAEVLMEGDHSIHDTAQITRKILSRLFAQLAQEGISVEQIILKTNMILPGTLHALATPGEVGKETVELLKDIVSQNIGGVVFLSGGQTGEGAIENLRAMQSYSLTTDYRLPTTFSFERVFEEPVLQEWSKDLKNIESAQQAFLAMARKVSGAL